MKDLELLKANFSVIHQILINHRMMIEICKKQESKKSILKCNSNLYENYNYNKTIVYG